MIEQRQVVRVSRGLGLVVLALGLAGLGGAGCRSSNKPESAQFASVEIRGNTPVQIADRLLEVFREDGYALAHGGADKFVFEKKASTLNNIAYGNWTETPVWVRVKVALVTAGDGLCRLDCHAFLLRDRGANTEEELSVSSLRSHPYQKLLNEVALRLAPPRPAGKKSAPPPVYSNPAQ